MIIRLGSTLCYEGGWLSPYYLLFCPLNEVRLKDLSPSSFPLPFQRSVLEFIDMSLKDDQLRNPWLDWERIDEKKVRESVIYRKSISLWNIHSAKLKRLMNHTFPFTRKKSLFITEANREGTNQLTNEDRVISSALLGHHFLLRQRPKTSAGQMEKN